MTYPVSSSVKIRTQYLDNIMPWNPGYRFVQWQRLVDGFVQRAPYTIATPCTIHTYQRVSGLIDGNSWATSVLGSDTWIDAQNKARSKLVGELGQSSSFGATLTAEARQTTDMIFSAVSKVVLSAKALRHGDILKAARILDFFPPEKSVTKVFKKKKVKQYRFDPVTERTYYVWVYRDAKKVTRTYWVMPSGKRVAKNLANRWLWWSYGVRPLMQDLYNGADILQRPQPASKIVGRGYRKAVVRQNGYYTNVYTYEVSCKCAANVRLNNPNLWLANQMGLVNPLMWINEAIPFSFVVDWFSNWSSVLSQYTDFTGLDIEEPLTTTVGKLNQVTYGPYYGTEEKTMTVFKRELSIPPVTLRFAYERFEWQRGANAISLLVGFLRK